MKLTIKIYISSKSGCSNIFCWFNLVYDYDNIYSEIYIFTWQWVINITNKNCLSVPVPNKDIFCINLIVLEIKIFMKWLIKIILKMLIKKLKSIDNKTPMK